MFSTIKICGLMLVFAALSSSKRPKADTNWWKHALFYHIFPKSFKDSNNDGIGDLLGVTIKLDHLKDVGATACLLSPIYVSPLVDGYDSSNFTDVHPEIGTLDTFDDMMAKAKQLGIRIVLDFVLNHSSDLHEWFLKSEKSEGVYKDFYVWRKPNSVTGREPNNWLSVHKAPAWQWSKKRKLYYLNQIDYRMPDLNYRSPYVLEHMKSVLGFWIDRGVDGFRFHATPYLMEHDGFQDEPPTGNLDAKSHDHNYLNHIFTKDIEATYNLVYEIRNFLDDYAKSHDRDTILFMADVDSELEHIKPYYGMGNILGAHLVFNLNLRKESNSASDLVKVIKKWMAAVGDTKIPVWALGNHDAERAASHYGVENIDGMNMLAAMLPGAQVVYMGEELGMEKGEVTFEQGQDPLGCESSREDFHIYSRDFSRTPYQWDQSVNAGFNKGNSTWLPVSPKFFTNNLATQKEQENSHFKIFKRLMELRAGDALAFGDFEIDDFNKRVVAVRRNLKDHISYVFVFNKSDKAIQVNVMKIFSSVVPQLQVVLTNMESTRSVGDIESSTTVHLHPYESIIFREVF